MKKFKTGKTYFCKSICDSNCIWNYRIEKRTKKSVWLNDGKEIIRVKIHMWKGEEICYPLGIYSMCPVLGAKSEVV